MYCLFKRMGVVEQLEQGTLSDYADYNKEYDASGTMRLSEESKYDLDNMKVWIAIRDKLTLTDDENAKGEWRTLRICKNPQKYGTYYLFIDIKNKRWRWRETASEFYGYRPKDFDPSELE